MSKDRRTQNIGLQLKKKKKGKKKKELLLVILKVLRTEVNSSEPLADKHTMMIAVYEPSRTLC